MSIMPNHLTPADNADLVLEITTRAEAAEAALGLARDDLKFARATRDTVIRQRDLLDARLTAIREFHEQWGSVDVEEMTDALELWEQLERILNPSDETAVPA